MIEKTIFALNDTNAGDHDLIEIVQLYISEGTMLLGFDVTRTTFDDLQNTGNLSILDNQELVNALSQLHTNFAKHNLSSTVNTNWVLPFDSKMTMEMDYFRFDPKTAHLYPKKATERLVQHIRDNTDLIQRNAGLHYWYINNVGEDYKNALNETEKVRAMIKKELEKS